MLCMCCVWYVCRRQTSKATAQKVLSHVFCVCVYIYMCRKYIRRSSCVILLAWWCAKHTIINTHPISLTHKISSERVCKCIYMRVATKLGFNFPHIIWNFLLYLLLFLFFFFHFSLLFHLLFFCLLAWVLDATWNTYLYIQMYVYLQRNITRFSYRTYTARAIQQWISSTHSYWFSNICSQTLYFMGCKTLCLLFQLCTVLLCITNRHVWSKVGEIMVRLRHCTWYRVK